MKVSDIARIEDPYTRFMQSIKFLRSLKATEEKAAEIRDRALLEVRQDPKVRMTQRSLAEEVGTTIQRINNMEKKARDRYGHEATAS